MSEAAARRVQVVAAVVLVATVVVTGILGVGQALDLVGQVDDFQRFDAPGETSLGVTDPGRYGVYHEALSAGGLADPATFTVRITGPDGNAVPVDRSEVAYGWGSRKAVAVAEFDADRPGPYVIEVVSGTGNMAAGKRVPPGPLRGFGPTLLLAGVIAAACITAIVVAAQARRRRGARPVGLAALGLAGAAAVALGGIVVLREIEGQADVVASDGGRYRDGPTTSTTSLEDCWDQHPLEEGVCAIPSPEMQRKINLGYADRLDFTGDRAAASAVVEEVRSAVQPLAATKPAPSVEQVRAALARWPAEVAANAVRTSGTAFGIVVEGGCVFGYVYDGRVEVEVGGFVKDGGCLAIYGH